MTCRGTSPRVSWPNETASLAASDEQMRRQGKYARPYECKKCGKYHVVTKLAIKPWYRK